MKTSLTTTTTRRMYRQLSLTTLTIIIVIIQMNSNDNSYVLCDFTYGYETDDFTLAIINLTYTDPHTGVQHSEYEEYGKYSIGRIGSVSGRMTGAGGFVTGNMSYTTLVHVSSNGRQTHDACEPIDADIYPPEPWIALAQYGNCRDSVKLKNIAATNASAAIIYNNRAGTRLIKMHHKAVY
ncbi:unnamed protein product [Medioppia subpectinata]|uniref:PA domain-containing protein n=1 Tax=Medioppia subpectinata TaxID=1979941 RepID=A0A7R9KRH9_9ACAR|nr:unnamed protein product [Medioppia subpectinata]CAG2107113.1 unnamed protein product [Medioppia subpectinata]